MSGDLDLLVGAGTYLTAYAVGVFDGDIQEVALACGLVVCDGTFDHVSEVVELVAVLDLRPALRAGPSVRALGIARAGCIEVTVRLLCGGDQNQDTVYVSLEFSTGRRARPPRR